MDYISSERNIYLFYDIFCLRTHHIEDLKINLIDVWKNIER